MKSLFKITFLLIALQHFSFGQKTVALDQINSNFSKSAKSNLDSLGEYTFSTDYVVSQPENSKTLESKPGIKMLGNLKYCSTKRGYGYTTENITPDNVKKAKTSISFDGETFAMLLHESGLFYVKKGDDRVQLDLVQKYGPLLLYQFLRLENGKAPCYVFDPHTIDGQNFWRNFESYSKPLQVEKSSEVILNVTGFGEHLWLKKPYSYRVHLGGKSGYFPVRLDMVDESGHLMESTYVPESAKYIKLDSSSPDGFPDAIISDMFDSEGKCQRRIEYKIKDFKRVSDEALDPYIIDPSSAEVKSIIDRDSGAVIKIPN